MSKMKRRSVTLYQAKEGRGGTDDLLKEPHAYKYFAVRNSDGPIGLLALKPTRRRRPRWLELFDGHLDEDPDETDVVSASVSAVFITSSETRSYALPFGYGRHMLADGVFEDRFGLKATLNAIDEERIRSLDRQTFERVQRHTREQVSQDSSFAAFGLDVEQDLLRAVTGVPDDTKRFGNRLTGKDSLTVAAEVSLDTLPEFIRRFEALAERDDYKERFAWVDHIQEVPKVQADALDAKLAHMMGKEELDRIWLGAPVLLDWETVSHFSYKTTGTPQRYAHLEWKDYFTEIRGPEEFGLRHLRQDRVYCFNANNDEIDTWQLRQCICAEVEEGETRFILSEGQWYAVHDDFAERVIQTIDAIESAELGLPPFSDEDEDETAYNARAAGRNEARFALMDRKNIPAPVARGSVEFCDILDVDRRMIHVKRYGGSSVLSHLFAQGVVSARQFQSDRVFRSQVNEHLPASHKIEDPTAPVSAADWEVAYAVIAKNRTLDRLPFFSMVNLKGVYDLLRQIGFSVTLTFLENHKEPSVDE